MELDSYEINTETLMIIPYEKGKSKVIEVHGELIINMTPLSIIKNSCLYFGSSYEGRRDSTKYTTGIEMKVPILIEDSREILFFPTNSCVHKDSIWISFQNLVRYNKVNDFTTMLFFKENVKIPIDIKYNLVDNQVIRCIKLDSILKRRKDFLNSNNFIYDNY